MHCQMMLVMHNANKLMGISKRQDRACSGQKSMIIIFTIMISTAFKACVAVKVPSIAVCQKRHQSSDGPGNDEMHWRLLRHLLHLPTECGRK